MNSKGFEFSFAWLFAMVVGAAILIVAVFLATRILDTAEMQSATVSAAELGVLLNPVETSLEEGKTYTIRFPEETRVINECFQEGTFGRQEISVSVQTPSGGWSRPGVPNVFYNKYVFSSTPIEGEEIELFTKPLFMPFKIGDIIVATSDSYCLVNPPEEVAEEIQSLGLRSFNISSTLRGCSQESTTVCFSQPSSCEIVVDTQSRTVLKQEKRLSYEGSLLYAAIVSDPALYECGVRRLLKRSVELSYVYIDKASLLSNYGCGSSLENDLRVYIQRVSNNASLADIQFAADTLKQKNEALTCKLF